MNRAADHLVLEPGGHSLKQLGLRFMARPIKRLQARSYSFGSCEAQHASATLAAVSKGLILDVWVVLVVVHHLPASVNCPQVPPKYQSRRKFLGPEHWWRKKDRRQQPRHVD